DGPSHRVVRRARTDLDAVAAVAEVGGASGVGADEVAQHHVARRAVTEEQHAVAPVAGDDVAGPGDTAPDRVVCCAAADLDAVAGVAEVGGPGGVGADEVPQHHVARRAAADEQHAVAPVAGDDVAGQGGTPAHRVVGRTAVDLDAVAAVAHG